jgi:release factor glutamine methyltransferase
VTTSEQKSGESGRNEPWTIRRVLTWATQDFTARGLDCPALDAELLLSHALSVDRIRLIVDSNVELGAEQLQAVRGLIQRRRTGEPVAYILGRREFYGLEFRVDPRVLIPRPDTEALIEVALRRTESRSLHGHALDLCTGSGCIAIALSKARATWQFLATDISADALSAARHNAERLGTHNLALRQGDLFESIEPTQFDLITSNPPYIPSAELAGLTVDVRNFEPRLALDGGNDGLDLIRRIVTGAKAFLAPNGVLAIEVGAGQAADVAALFQSAGYREIERQRDYGGHERVVSGQLEP